MLQKNDTTLPYHAFGMEMPGRKWTASNYRYSHNGHEKEEEIFAGANSAEFWMYDSRIGRRWELDPIQREYESPYACFSNNPIYFSDLLGLAPGGGDKGKNKTQKEKKEANMNKKTSDGTWKINDDGKPEYTKNTPNENKPTAAPTGNNQPNKGEPQKSNTQKPHKNINFNTIANKWRAWDNSLENLFKHVPDNDEWFKKGPPIKTKDGGFMPYGEGASKNIWKIGNPQDSWSSVMPGVTLYSVGKPNPWDFATIGKLPKHYEDFKKTVEQVESYFDAGYGFIGFITSKIDENKPAISNGNSDTVYQKVIETDGSYHWSYFVVTNGDTSWRHHAGVKKPKPDKKVMKKLVK